MSQLNSCAVRRQDSLIRQLQVCPHRCALPSQNAQHAQHFWQHVETDYYCPRVSVLKLTPARAHLRGHTSKRLTWGSVCWGGVKVRFDVGSFYLYTQFAIQDSGLFGPNPWKFLAQIVYVFPWRATQPLEQILDSEFLLCELSIVHPEYRLAVPAGASKGRTHIHTQYI